MKFMNKKISSKHEKHTVAWIPLSQKERGDVIFHGAVIRCLGKWPYENIVDFMILEGIDKDRGATIIVSSGYKAGLLLVNLPKESEENNGEYVRCLNAEWLKLNWTKWVYPECDIENVYISDGYLPAASLPELG
jgi:hypothetical protein